MADSIHPPTRRGASGLVLKPLFEFVELHGGDVDALLVDQAQTVEALGHRFSWVDWDTYVAIESRAAEQLRHVPEAFADFGRFTILHQRVGFAGPLLGQLAEPIHMFRLIPVLVPRFFMACLDIRLHAPENGRRRFQLDYRWVDGAVHTEALLQCIEGQLSALPCILGEPEAQVQAVPRDASFAEIRVQLAEGARDSTPRLTRPMAWARSMARRTLHAGEVGDELLRTNLLLAEKLDELEEANQRLRQEAEARQQAVEEARASEERYRVLAETALDLIYVLGPDGTIRYVNRCGASSVGLSPEQIIGRRIQDVGSSDTAVTAEEALEQVLATGEPLRLEHPSRGPNGVVWYDTQLATLRSPAGEITAVLGVTRDITERRNAEAEREQTNSQLQEAKQLESLGVLAGGIAHDFNNLLTIISGNAELAQEILDEDHPVWAKLRPIREASRRAAELCRLLLAYAGKGRLEVRPVDLSLAVRDLEGLLLASLQPKVELHYELAESLPWVEADPAHIRQIILNVVVNAGEALETLPGRVTVRTYAADLSVSELRRCTLTPETLLPGPFAVLEVTDTGCGMDEDTQRRAFEPFFSTKFTGRGLGLAAVLGIVRRAQGAVHIDSAPGRGTRLRIYLPGEELSEDSDLRQPVDVRKRRPPPAGRVLLVDDDLEVRVVGQRLLESLGLKVAVAVDGVDALDKFRCVSHPFDVVILDLSMPRMDGEEAFRALREVAPDVPVIISSGFGAQDVQERFAEATGVGFVHKPYELVELIEALRSTLRSSVGTDLAAGNDAEDDEA